LKIEAVNSNGVGDVFHGAYTLAIGEGADVREPVSPRRQPPPNAWK
jgi:sugar/nucleoside kinase (ribokinase family)